MRYGISTAHVRENRQAQEYKSIWSSYRQGMLTSLANPKALLFFMALFPQSTRPDYFVQDIVYFGALKMLSLGTVMISYGLMGRRLFNYIGHSSWSNAISPALGGGMIITAIAVARG